MSLKKNLLYNFLLSLSQVAFPLLSIPYITRVLDPFGIGKVGFIDSLTYYFVVVAELGIATYGIREVARKRERPAELKILVSELFSLHLLASGICAVVYLFLLVLLYSKIASIYLIFFSISFLLVNSLACEWYFWGTERFKYITIRSLFTRALGLVSIFLLVKKPPDYVVYYGIITGTAVINYVWNFLRMLTEVEVRLNNLQWRKHLSKVWITYRISLVYSVVLLLDNVFLQLLSTSIAVAYYMFAAKVVRISGAMVTDTLLVFYPRTVYQAQNKSDALQKTIFYSTQLITVSTVPMTVGIFLLADKLTTIYFGNAFQPLAADLRILAFYPLLKSYSLFLNKQLLMPFDQENLVLKGLVFGAAVFVGLTIPLSYFLADKGTSLAVILSETAVVLTNLAYVRKYRTGLLLFDWRSFWQAVIGSLLFMPVILLVEAIFSILIWQLLVSIALCMACYFGFLFAIGNGLIMNVINSIKKYWVIKPKHEAV